MKLMFNACAAAVLFFSASGCVSVQPIADDPQALTVCASDGEVLYLLSSCQGHTSDGLDCKVCRDYAGCVVGRGEGAAYCVSARLGCSDPACAY